MAAPAKLTDADVKRIRRRVQAGEHQTALADEFGVDRKTIRRRLDALELSETERAERMAEKRLRRPADREKQKLPDRERGSSLPRPIERSRPSGRPTQPARVPDPYFEWLDRPKNLSGRALADCVGSSEFEVPMTPVVCGLNALTSMPSSMTAGCWMTERVGPADRRPSARVPACGAGPHATRALKPPAQLGSGSGIAPHRGAPNNAPKKSPPKADAKNASAPRRT